MPIETMPGRCRPFIVSSRNAVSGKCSRKAWSPQPPSLVLPKQAHVPPMLTEALHQPPDKPLLPVETAPGQRDSPVVSSRHTTSGSCPPKNKTARKQSESVKNPSREQEGMYLARAAAYIQECLAKCSLARDMAPSRKNMLPKPTEIEARWHNANAVSKGTTDVVEHIPHTTAAQMLPMVPLTCPTRAEVLCQSSNELMLPSPSVIEDYYKAVDKVIKATLMACPPQDESLATLTPCSPRAKCSMAVSDPANGRNDVDFPSTPASPASPHEDGELAH
jgi:hypothetical protein